MIQGMDQGEMLFGAAAADKVREARDVLVSEQHAKLWAYRNLENHRKVCCSML